VTLSQSKKIANQLFRVKSTNILVLLFMN